MNISDNFTNQALWGKFSSLKKSSDRLKKMAFKKRITQNPHATDLEYMLGAFLEMYDPHLVEIILKLFEKGYAIDSSSGFNGKNAESQAMTGDFSIDYVTKNKLEKIGVKFREFNGSKSLIFWPEEATLANINSKWIKILDALPDKGKLNSPSLSSSAVCFRRKYVPQDRIFRKQRLFEKLKFITQKKVDIETKKRQKDKSHPNEYERILGLFIEEIEPQVRQAIITMNKKGYSTDKSGFMDNPCDQMIEGDFQLDEQIRKKLEIFGVQVETNPSGYTRLQFSPLEADISKIKTKWNKIAAMLPNRKETASISMTRKARDFRMEYR